MTSTHESKEALEVLKTDLLGRVRTPASRREAILDEFERSGMSGQAFAKYLGIKYSTFASWLQRRRRERGKEPDRGGREVIFLEAEVSERESAASLGSIEVESPAGFKVRLNHRGQIALAVECLRAFKG